MQLIFFTCILIASVAIRPAYANELIVGINSVTNSPMSEEQEDEFIDQLEKNGVKVIRQGLDANHTRMIVRAYKRGIGTVAMLHAQGNRKHIAPKDPSVGRLWAVGALSDIDVEKSKVAFDSLIGALEAQGVRCVAFELENEINTPRFNGDFPAHGTGRVLGIGDLENTNDTEARTIAAGYRAYVQCLAALKEVRDNSKLNKKTPIISAGLASWGAPKPHSSSGLVEVSLVDTLKYMRVHGLDDVVDGYGVHVYPSSNVRVSLAERIRSLDHDIFPKLSTKWYWLTEWGFPNTSPDCPIDDTARKQVIAIERQVFKEFASQGRLAAIIYYRWWSGPGATKEDRYSVFRCGSLTAAGKMAIMQLKL